MISGLLLFILNTKMPDPDGKNSNIIFIILGLCLLGSFVASIANLLNSNAVLVSTGVLICNAVMFLTLISYLLC